MTSTFRSETESTTPETNEASARSTSPDELYSISARRSDTIEVFPNVPEIIDTNDAICLTFF